jgi:hypothetical protein
LNSLYNRVCSVVVGSKKFTAPPFAIEFEQSFALGALSTGVVRLFNPAPDTIKIAEGIPIGNTKRFPQVIVDAGYEDFHGTTMVGEIYDFTVKQQGTERILEMKISDQTFKWSTALINKTFAKQRASSIIQIMLASVGINGAVELANDKFYESFTAIYFSQAIQQIVRDCGSIYYFRDGVFYISPSTPTTELATLLSAQTGLLGKPEKTQNGLKVRTLFLYNIGNGSWVQIKSADVNQTGKILNGKKKFSTFGESVCEFEVIK